MESGDEQSLDAGTSARGLFAAGGAAAAGGAPKVSSAPKRPTAVKKPVAYGDDKLHTWPFLVRAEFLCAMAVTVVLVIWSLTINAPLEEPANPTRTPNP